MNNTEKKMTFKDYAVVSSLLFGLFFGAGNLIFPLHLGQLAGHTLRSDRFLEHLGPQLWLMKLV